VSKYYFHVIIFILLVNWIYLAYISPQWGYLGASATYRLDGFIISIIISFIPSIPLLKSQRQTISGWVSLLLYYYSYIPMAVVLSYECVTNNYNDFLILPSLLLSFYLFVYVSIKDFSLVLRPKRFYLYRSINGLLFLNIAILIFIVFSVGSQLNFVNPFGDDVYTQRFIARDSVSRSVVTDYLIMLSSGVITPLILSYGFYKKRLCYITFAIIAFTLLYSIAANKGYLFSIFFIFLIAKLSKRDSVVYSFLKFNSFFSLFVFLLGLLFSGFFLYEIFMAVFGVRFLMISGINSSTYYEFFINHQYTYYSHLNIVNRIFKSYPYGDLQIGQVIGEYFYGSADANFNANFFLTDGFAAAGSIGLIVIGLFGGVVLCIINFVLSKHDYRFLIMPFSIVAVLLMNVSIFTTLLSGGLLFLVIYLFFLSSEKV
jgi:hypothetical protein